MKTNLSRIGKKDPCRHWYWREAVDLEKRCQCVWRGLWMFPLWHFNEGCDSPRRRWSRPHLCLAFWPDLCCEICPGPCWSSTVWPRRGLIRGKFKVESLQNTLSQVHCGNRANVRMVCHGTLLDPTTTIAFAAKVGPLRAKIYCLPGGVNWTLTSILTELQSLLLKHGHPSKEVEKRLMKFTTLSDTLDVKAFLKPKIIGRCSKLRVLSISSCSSL